MSRGALLGLASLAAIGCHRAAARSQAEPRTVSPAAAPACQAQRPPDIVDVRGPYRVALRCWGGAAVSGGLVAYTVRQGEASREGRAALVAGPAAGEWWGEIPGAPAGSAIAYHFLLEAPPATLRQPTHPAAQYRFQVLSVRALGVELLPGSNGEAELRVRLAARSRPSGELVVRLLPERAAEQQLPLEISAAGPGAWLATATLPPLEPGQISDFFVQLRTEDGATARVPPGAPLQAFSRKRPLRSVHPVAGERAAVTDLAAGADGWWGAHRGSGVWSGGQRAGGAGRAVSIAREATAAGPPRAPDTD
jgi:hypothetical protein